MIAPDRLEAWRRMAAIRSVLGSPIGNALLDACDEIKQLQAKLDQPCGSCHPCSNYADETWRAAGRKPPHVHIWDETLAEVKRLRAALKDAAEQVAEADSAVGAVTARAHAAEQRLHRVATAKVWTNEDGKKFVLADDLYAALNGGEGQC